MIKSGGTSALFYVFAQLTMQQFTEKEVRESYGQALRIKIKMYKLESTM